ncbi:hypothetical protein [Rhizobium sp. LjRoot258]|uniref:hypothetical protein n=1 Tax=Rhizobium sp. LjRoot258 TaxID=3342299 RepID=UPI003ECE3B72
MADAVNNWKTTLSRSTRGPALFGYGAIVVMLGSFGFWGATAPISGAAVATGAIAAAGRNIQMQHLEGGIVREIKVREGDVVSRGDMVMILDDTAAKTQLNRLTKQWVSLSAQIQRLEAERDGQKIFNPLLARQNITDDSRRDRNRRRRE